MIYVTSPCWCFTQRFIQVNFDVRLWIFSYFRCGISLTAVSKYELCEILEADTKNILSIESLHIFVFFISIIICTCTESYKTPVHYMCIGKWNTSNKYHIVQTCRWTPLCFYIKKIAIHSTGINYDRSYRILLVYVLFDWTCCHDNDIIDLTVRRPCVHFIQ